MDHPPRVRSPAAASVDLLDKAGVVCVVLGSGSEDKQIRISYNGTTVLDEKMLDLREWWEETSYQLERLQVNPDCAIQLDPQARDYGWLYVKGPDAQWVTHRKVEGIELDFAHDQAVDMQILQGTKVRAG